MASISDRSTSNLSVNIVAQIDALSNSTKTKEAITPKNLLDGVKGMTEYTPASFRKNPIKFLKFKAWQFGASIDEGKINRQAEADKKEQKKEYEKTLDYKMKLRDKYRKDMNKAKNENDFTHEHMFGKFIETSPFYYFFQNADENWILACIEVDITAGTYVRNMYAEYSLLEVSDDKIEKLENHKKALLEEISKRDYYRYLLTLFYTRRTPELKSYCATFLEAEFYEILANKELLEIEKQQKQEQAS